MDAAEAQCSETTTRPEAAAGSTGRNTEAPSAALEYPARRLGKPHRAAPGRPPPEATGTEVRVGAMPLLMPLLFQNFPERIPGHHTVEKIAQSGKNQGGIGESGAGAVVALSLEIRP